MKTHVKIYLKFFGYTIADFVPCEICGAKAVDIHHIICRGMGGSWLKDIVENLMALCRKCHEKFGDKKQHVEYLQKVHQEKIESTKSSLKNINPLTKLKHEKINKILACRRNFISYRL